MRPITGIHHVTAIATDPQRNLDFYTGVLGLRLVKVTVNFDLPDTYHLYYADASGSPGSVLTFFPWPQAKRGSRGTGQVTSLSFSVPPGSLGFWSNRLFGFGASFEESQKFGERVLVFTDPDGLLVELVEGEATPCAEGWHGGGVPAEASIQCLHSVAITEADAGPTGAFLAEVIGLRELEHFGRRTRYRASGQCAAVVDVVSSPSLPAGQVAAGTVHHVAFRAADDAEQAEWRQYLVEKGLEVTPVRDRQYFHSIYFNEPGSVLFEIATDTPGFAIDEAEEALGSSLKLPPWLEARRSEIEHHLPHLELKASRNFV